MQERHDNKVTDQRVDAKVEDLGNVGVLDLRSGAHLLAKALDHLGIAAAVGQQQLDGYLDRQALVASPIHGREAALADGGLDAVPIFDNVAERRVGMHDGLETRAVATAKAVLVGVGRIADRAAFHRRAFTVQGRGF